MRFGGSSSGGGWHTHISTTHPPNRTQTGVSTSLGISRVLTPISAILLDLIICDHNRLRVGSGLWVGGWCLGFGGW